METKKLYDEYLITSMVPAFDPVEIESARGASVHCTSGKVYLDCFSGIAVCNAGHGHPKVIAAAKADGADAITLTGRPGWKRALVKWGWQPVYTTMMLEV